MTADALEQVVTMLVEWQNVHAEWASSTSAACREVADLALLWSVTVMRVLEEPSPHIGGEVIVKYLPNGQITERRVGSLRLQRVVCPGGEWYSIV